MKQLYIENRHSEIELVYQVEFKNKFYDMIFYQNFSLFPLHNRDPNYNQVYFEEEAFFWVREKSKHTRYKIQDVKYFWWEE